MKYLFVFLVVGLMVSCGGSDASGDATGKIGDLEVNINIEKRMKWHDAKKACTDLGDGWRLPTKDELNMLYENKDKIDGFDDEHFYWSSTRLEDNSAKVWIQHMSDGFQMYTTLGGQYFYIIAVRPK